MTMACCHTVGVSQRRDIAKIIRRAEEQGFKVREAKEYWLVFGPNDVPRVDKPCTIGHTPSSSKALPNFVACLRRKGYRA